MDDSRVTDHDFTSNHDEHVRRVRLSRSFYYEDGFCRLRTLGERGLGGGGGVLPYKAKDYGQAPDVIGCGAIFSRESVRSIQLYL